MASLWKLPVIYVIENNRYAMGTSVTRSSAETDFSHRGASFRIPGIQVDGMDVLAVRGAAETALEWTRAGKGPVLLELKKMDAEIREIVNDAADFATNDPEPDAAELWTDILV